MDQPLQRLSWLVKRQKCFKNVSPKSIVNFQTYFSYFVSPLDLIHIILDQRKFMELLGGKMIAPKLQANTSHFCPLLCHHI